MRYFLNITFVSAEADFESALSYLREVFLPAVLVAPVQDCRLCRVHSSATEAASIACEFALPDFHSIKPWKSSILSSALDALSSRWGERLMYFDTVLQELS